MGATLKLGHRVFFGDTLGGSQGCDKLLETARQAGIFILGYIHNIYYIQSYRAM